MPAVMPFAPAFRFLRAPSWTVPAAPAAPAAPNTPDPADTAETLYGALSWLSARQAHADVYLDTVTPPVALVSIKQVGFTYAATLLPNTRYYWQVVAFNDGGSAAGPVWSFTTPTTYEVIVALAGVRTTRVRYGSCSIHDILNAQPNTASFTVDTAPPTVGEDVRIGLGSLDVADLLFAGTVQTIDDSYQDLDDNPLWPVGLVDYTFTLNKRRPFGVYVNVSVTTIARDLVTRYAQGFTSVGVQDGLAAVSIVFDGSEDFMTCLGRLALAVDGYADVSYDKDVQLFQTDDGAEPPDPLDGVHPPLNTPPLAFSVDRSQVRTRVYGKGHGEAVPCAASANETIVPIVDGVMFAPAGGRAITSTTSDGAQSEILTYAGVQLGGDGSLVGPGVQPTVKPTITGAVGSGFSDGARTWAYTWVTAAGESLPSPLSVTVTGETIPTPGALDSVSTGDPLVGGPRAGAIKYAITLRDQASGAESVIGPVTDYVAVGNAHVDLAFTVTAAMIGRQVSLARSDDGGVTYYGGHGAAGIGPLAPSSLGTVQHLDDVTLNAPSYITSPPTTGASAIKNQATIAGVAVGPTGTTSRKVYRTAAAPATQLQLQQTIANNTATVGVTDATPDASLGANVPIVDASGLVQTTGQINAGATSIPTAGASPFQALGGWAQVDQQWIRYTGISANTLTGIPATGVGAITTTIPYGQAIVAAPALTGVNANNGLARAMAKGSTVKIWVQRDDLPAQVALGLLELDEDGNPTDGIREHLIVDERRGEASLTALCDADLARFSRPIVSVSYTTRDPKSTCGCCVSISLALGPFDAETCDPLTMDCGTPFGLEGDFLIQEVTITFDPETFAPRYAVRAASVSFTLMDLLRLVVLA